MEGTYFKRKFLSRKDVQDALARFGREFADSNDYEDWLENPAYKYAVRHAGRLYPPKRILSSASGFDTAEFNGGEQTNRVFRQLGFEVIDKP